jgi:hypothetical protein
MTTAMRYLSLSFLFAAIAMLMGYPLAAVGVAYIAGFVCGLLWSLGMGLWQRVIDRLFSKA